MPVIDSVALVWGHALGTAERRVEAPAAGRRAEPLSPPVRLDFARLLERFGSDDGEVRVIRYKGGPLEAGHWKVGDVELLYREGRLELRASLPKIVAGGNEVVLDERGVHAGLRELVRRGAELADHPLELRQAVPSRLDYVYHWQVPSVAFVLEHFKAAFSPARKLRTETISKQGGRSLVWGYGSKRVIRFYDKVAEVTERALRDGEIALEHGLSAGELEQLAPDDRRRAVERGRRKARDELWRTLPIDTELRYEIQDRRRSHLRLVHERGYRADDVRGELQRVVQGLADVACRDFAAALRDRGQSPHAVAYVAADFHFFEHPEDLAVLRRLTSRPTAWRWARRARRMAMYVGEFAPEIPDDAFEAPSSLWSLERAAAA